MRCGCCRYAENAIDIVDAVDAVDAKAAIAITRLVRSLAVSVRFRSVFNLGTDGSILNLSNRIEPPRNRFHESRNRTDGLIRF